MPPPSKAVVFAAFGGVVAAALALKILAGRPKGAVPEAGPRKGETPDAREARLAAKFEPQVRMTTF